MDLGSTNGTFLNGERIEAERYYELLEKVGAGLFWAQRPRPRAGRWGLIGGRAAIRRCPAAGVFKQPTAPRLAVQDLLRFGNSTREYVLLKEQ